MYQSQFVDPHFTSPYIPSPEVIAMVNQTLDQIELHPEAWDQVDYGNSYSATNCFFGTLIRVSGIDPYDEDKGYFGFGIHTGMIILGMSINEHWGRHWDRAEYISYYQNNGKGVHPTVQELRERVSKALNHDFTKKNDTNVVITDEGDPTVTN